MPLQSPFPETLMTRLLRLNSLSKQYIIFHLLCSLTAGLRFRVSGQLYCHLQKFIVML